MKKNVIVICAVISAIVFILISIFQPSSQPHPDPKLRSYESVTVINKFKSVDTNKYRSVIEYKVTVQLSDDSYKTIDINEDWFNIIEIGQDIDLPMELVNVDFLNQQLILDILLSLSLILFCMFLSILLSAWIMS